MAILKSIAEPDIDFGVIFKRNKYVTDLAKTSPALIGARGCSMENFPTISCALKRFYRKGNHKMLRHFVVAISQEDEGKLQNTELLKAARKVAAFFKDCYVLYAVHTDTAHTHFHMLVCNTRISDGKQINMSDSDLKQFKEHCSSVLREYGLRPIEKLDKSDESPEISDDLFPKELSQDERTSILYNGISEPWYDKQQYCRPVPVQNCGNITNINVIIPPGTQGTLFQGRNGQPCLSFKPSPHYGQLPPGDISQNNAVYGGNTTAGYPIPELPSYSSDWYDQEPEWVKYGQSDSSEVEVYGHTREEVTDDDNCYYNDNYDGDEDDDRYYEDEDDDYQEVVQNSSDNKPLDEGALTDIPNEKIDPFKIFKRIPAEMGENGKIIPFEFLKEIKE